MAGLEILTEVFVPGRPHMKGSTVYVTRQYAKQSDAGVGDYQRLIAQAVRTDRERHARASAPAGVAVVVRVVFWVEGGDLTAPGAALYQPTQTRSGDIDKMVRAVLDALTKGGAYGDDVQVVKLSAEQYWTHGDGQPGTTVQAFIQPVTAAQAGRHAAGHWRDEIRARQNMRRVDA